MLCSSRSLVATMQGSSSSASGTNHLRIMGCQCWWKWFWDEVRMKDGRYLVGFSCQFVFEEVRQRARGFAHEAFCQGAPVCAVCLSVNTKVESSFNCKQSEVPFAMTKETKQDRGWVGSRILQLTTSVPVLFQKKHKPATGFRIDWAALSWSSPWIFARSIPTGGWWVVMVGSPGWRSIFWTWLLARLAETKLPVSTPKFYYGDISNETSNYILITERVPFSGVGGRTDSNFLNMFFSIAFLCVDLQAMDT